MNFFRRNYHRMLLTFDLHNKQKKLSLALEDSQLARIILDDGRHYGQLSPAEQASILQRHIKESEFLLALSKTPLRKRISPINNSVLISAIDQIGQDEQVETMNAVTAIATSLHEIITEKSQSRVNAAACILKENSSLLKKLDSNEKMQVVAKYTRIPLQETDKTMVAELAQEDSRAALILSKNKQLLNSIPNQSATILTMAIKHEGVENFCEQFISNLKESDYDFEEECTKNFQDRAQALSYRNIANQISVTKRLEFIVFCLGNNDMTIISRLPNLISNISSADLQNNQDLVDTLCSVLKEKRFHEELLKTLASENSSGTFIDDFIRCCKAANTSIIELLLSFAPEHWKTGYFAMLIKIGLNDFDEAKALLGSETGKNIIEGHLSGISDKYSQTFLLGINELLIKHLEKHPNDPVLLPTKKDLAVYNAKLVEENCQILDFPKDQERTLVNIKRFYNEKILKTHSDKSGKKEDDEKFEKLKSAVDVIKLTMPLVEQPSTPKASVDLSNVSIHAPSFKKPVSSPQKTSNSNFGFFTSVATSVKSFFSGNKADKQKRLAEEEVPVSHEIGAGMGMSKNNSVD